MNGYYRTITKQELCDIIKGKIRFSKCLCCNNDGMVFWDENGQSVLSYPYPDWGENYDSGECDNCDGLGFVRKNG